MTDRTQRLLEAARAALQKARKLDLGLYYAEQSSPYEEDPEITELAAAIASFDVAPAQPPSLEELMNDGLSEDRALDVIGEWPYR